MIFGKRPPFPDGHFYSPIVDTDEVAKRAAALWPDEPIARGIDFNDASHRDLLVNAFPRYLPDYDYPDALEETAELQHYYTDNTQFGWLDSRTLFVLLRSLRPKRIIEVGSGFSSLLIADVNRRFLDTSIDFTCIEPYPRAFLKQRIAGISRLIEMQVQDVSPSEFEVLEAGDFLFIDSSHVSKTGSDVNHLYFEVLPLLKPGVFVHIHDIFLPGEYLQDWVLGDRRSWNEQYLVRALLMYSTAFKVIFGSWYAFHRFPEMVGDALGRPGFGGGSLWLQVQAHD